MTNTRTCIRCGKAIASDRKIAKYCPECASEIHREAIRQPRVKTCIDCGADFIARSARSMRCPACQTAYSALNNLERTLAYQHGKSRKLGHEYPCARCGELFVLSATTQRYCKKCSVTRQGRARVVASKTCPRCGATIDATRDLCAKCSHADLLRTIPGADLSRVHPAAAVRCVDCGVEFECKRCDTKYCPECKKKRQRSREIASRKKRRERLALEAAQNKEDNKNDLQ